MLFSFVLHIMHCFKFLLFICEEWNDEEVARGFDKIKDVDDSKDVWVLAVRIVDLWPVIGKYKSESSEMIVKDAEVSFYFLSYFILTYS